MFSCCKHDSRKWSRLLSSPETHPQNKERSFVLRFAVTGDQPDYLLLPQSSISFRYQTKNCLLDGMVFKILLNTQWPPEKFWVPIQSEVQTSVLVTCYATLPPALSVRPSVTLFFFCGLWPHCSCPNNQVTSNTVPAHPHATGVAVYPALFNSTVMHRPQSPHSALML